MHLLKFASVDEKIIFVAYFLQGNDKLIFYANVMKVTAIVATLNDTDCNDTS